ncbi:hypothetical protein F0562_030637 [Nyssa sinensis]|uniref:Protein kinase domain-containing protein n=1 Tax=Nyssa sinensis TaxID=561372 RepID=A0A5J5AYW0_9ASTE|nr:hypothetical protein F0562_030637 [Nyssa sinensis]
MGLHWVFHIINLLWLTKTLAFPAPFLPRKGGDCVEECGNISIPYPFGIQENCWLDTSFAIDCNITRGHPTPFLRHIRLEVLNISLPENTIRVNNPVFYSNCPGRKNSSGVNLGGSPFFFSYYNTFTAVGCDQQAIMSDDDSTIWGCKSTCDPGSQDNICNGTNCCQTSIPSRLRVFNVTWNNVDADKGQSECAYAFLAEQERYEERYTPTLAYASAVNSSGCVPAKLGWTIFHESYLSNFTRDRSFSCDTFVYYINGSSEVQCRCKWGYEGNPYLQDGCQDINECNDPKVNRCGKSCVNTPGSYRCDNRAKIAIIGVSSGIGLLLLLIVTWWLYKVLKKRNNRKRKEKFFKRNGGLLLQQQLSSSEGGVQKTKLFSSKELETATDNYNENRVLGQGGQGTVYKGMLTDGRIVAVKKAKMVDEGNVEQFINEVAILSQINHRNVVKLLGCCLEIEVPLLVYEFVSNGTLLQHIHDPNEEFPLSWEMRLRIAIEIAGALSYLHSAASIPIYHRDIKSTNILLDEKYRAKVSDFGASRSVSLDQTHLTTLVQGTFGYLDPEYFQSSQFTDKSDVYSFGVVIVELLTGQKPISSTRAEEGRSLTAYFVQSMKENNLFEILDPQVLKEAKKEELVAVASLAKRCLHLNGRKRPTMKEVAGELEGIRISQGGSTIDQQNYEEAECITIEMNEAWDTTSTSTKSCFDIGIASSLDVQPLLLNTS